MEEIVASISRIIAEDSSSGRQARNRAAEKTTILELTEAIEADGSIRNLGASPAAVAEAPETTPAPSAAANSEPPPEKPAESMSAEPAERILSAATSDAVATAFLRLGSVPRERPGADLPIGDSGRSLEAIFREALRPLLQTWLDDHLPALVERLVREEIQRIVSQAGLR